VSRYGTGGFAIQSVRSNYDYLVLRDRTGSDGSHCLVATELEANSKSLIPSIITMHILLLVRCQHVHNLGTNTVRLISLQISNYTLLPFVSNMPYIYVESQHTGSLFYMTNIACHFRPLLRRVWAADE
jgi:hypothetical protein